ncbi:hypothetical protein EC915_10379 [Pseudomonas sp. LP_7_YM]|nr:hypothetical protein EC915_10379 [Pseudomonas sp. LP_7_YM]
MNSAGIPSGSSLKPQTFLKNAGFAAYSAKGKEKINAQKKGQL